MRLFHGSNMEIDKVDLSKCMPNKDFGCGFYTTLLEEQAWRMAQRRARIDGGIPTVTVYEVPDDLAERSDLNCRIFDDKPTIEWAIFIKNNRDRKFTDISSRECNLDCKFDVVIGPVANDTVGLNPVVYWEHRCRILQKEFDFGYLQINILFMKGKGSGSI